jgi:hypothetical protein
MKISKTKVEKDLNDWLVNNGFYGYDPYDIFSQASWYRRVYLSKNVIIRNTFSRIIGLTEMFFPLQARKILRIKKTINAKGMGLVGLGYLHRYKRTRNEDDKNRVFEIVDWLLANSNKSYSGKSWGYPFDWQSRIFIPEGTPSIVVSYTVADFLFSVYEEFKDENCLNAVVEVCEFISKSLNQTNFDDGTICFSYTPLDNFQVHNANLFGAELLVRIGKLMDNKTYLDLGIRSIRFALKEQLSDGSLNYWGNAQNADLPNKNDHYHVGFEIRMLTAIASHLGDDEILKAAQKYYNYYLNNFVEYEKNEVIPKMDPQSIYPLDIHACAESVILNCRLAELWGDDKSRKLSHDFLIWIMKNMVNRDGSFAYKKYRYGALSFNVKIPHLRWGQAWMFYALNYHLAVFGEKS